MATVWVSVKLNYMYVVIAVFWKLTSAMFLLFVGAAKPKRAAWDLKGRLADMEAAMQSRTMTNQVITPFPFCNKK